MTNHDGDSVAFDSNWRQRPETTYLHWTRGDPVNQIQLAFRQHWLTFNELIGERNGKRRCLEVGCGRGSLSAYFADAGWDCTLLDLSEAAIDQATKAFTEAGLVAKFDVGNCLELPYEDGNFDLVFSIGLLEHFEDIGPVISEQVRVLAPGGIFIGYVVPHLPNCIQKDYEWINDVLRAIIDKPDATLSAKSEIYRSDALSQPYLEIMELLGLKNCQSEGTYPLPMISHSPDFPFSLLPPVAEKSLVATFQKWLLKRQKRFKRNPWLCPEGEGQAFLIWGEK